MNERPRTEDKSRFATQFTDQQFLDAVGECLKKATIPASEVAKELGCNPRTAKNRLLELRDKGELDADMVGQSWGFSLPKKKDD